LLCLLYVFALWFMIEIKVIDIDAFKLWLLGR